MICLDLGNLDVNYICHDSTSLSLNPTDPSEWEPQELGFNGKNILTYMTNIMFNPFIIMFFTVMIFVLGCSNSIFVDICCIRLQMFSFSQ